ncbi:MAG: EamA family transporter [Candidatus Marinimicrobia bacterium]|nr:EamA family transporter [Candidatus Neomarinimicrobiota bacterium]MBL7022938.1 EamA family transporter [Candidatus Neomarinimicrobiota bacterium]MBL7108756.1 EamA family transporter [Candidatus Neomarinimicrobiota bacterium]
MSPKIVILLFVAMLSVSTSPLLAKWLDSVPALLISFWRMTFASMALWGYSAFKPKVNLSSSGRNKTIVAGIFLGIHFAFFFGALKYTTIANATFLGTLAPVFTLIIERNYLKRKFNSPTMFGIILALIGAGIILGYKFDLSAENTLGNILALTCSIWLAIVMVISENIRTKDGTLPYTRMLYFVSAFTLLILILFSGDSLTGFSNKEYFGLLMLGIIPTILGHNSMYYAMRYVSPTVVATFPLGEPILATIFGAIIFGGNEIPQAYLYVGGLVTLSGLLLLTLKNSQNGK